ncbi:hypothetical protein ARMSODRAFT_69205 [Armillaria solidipes]|uniref:Uncharacterized protein n=1 Tax=Armillaria solidipes TaxID=1076256 RepID=A0A2H3C363_9AGAR|nr:hypothetical protein ARMSODRAFT_69205 [Armillaria solidipes]
MGRTLFYTAPSSTSLTSCRVGRDLSKLTDTILDLKGYFASPAERKDIIMDVFLGRIHISRRWRSSSSAGQNCSCYIKRQLSSSSTCIELGKTVKLPMRTTKAWRGRSRWQTSKEITSANSGGMPGYSVLQTP